MTRRKNTGSGRVNEDGDGEEEKDGLKGLTNLLKIGRPFLPPSNRNNTIILQAGGLLCADSCSTAAE